MRCLLLSTFVKEEDGEVGLEDIRTLAREPGHQKEVVALGWLDGRLVRTFATLALLALVCWEPEAFVYLRRSDGSDEI